MKVLDAKQYLLGDQRFMHMATVREGLRDYVCFCESKEFFARRKVLTPFPPKPQIYVEEIRPLTAHSFSFQVIDDEELWKAIVGLLVIEGIVKQNDLLDGYHDCVAVFNERSARMLNESQSKTKTTNGRTPTKTSP